ncbi:transcription antitermination factor NusB [Botrimarina hoheduenensis]|uniref:Transcription antitermination protein NusB n=1 Tax=Botrimarina hoheduenensis TaxID=2528000 RepID=A0A5C5WDW3_9BACT|nr:transcription antitermination factor NusB [Botrimarina hoheduenensis]TWT48904.1 hypothetical protein Pla111_06810 [Botrimarina hoheduenensis]
MSQRRRAREVALQVLFEDDVNTRATSAEMESFLRGRLRNRGMEQFSLDLILGTRRNLSAIDLRLGEVAANWSLKRMAGVDRNVLRLAAYEILFAGTPFRVAVNEAIELAKRFGSAQSGAFVNGILDRLKPEVEGQPAPGMKKAEA